MSSNDPDTSKPSKPRKPETEPDKRDPQPSTVPTEGGPREVDEDVSSDPALDDRLGSDWTDEGGAATSGPATAARERQGDEN